MRGLKSRREFLFVQKGKKAPRPAVMVEARRRAADGPSGVGFTATKKIGIAVIRNRAKRRLREAVRQIAPGLALPGVDYVFVARPATARAPWEAVQEDVRAALTKLRLELAP